MTLAPRLALLGLLALSACTGDQLAGFGTVEGGVLRDCDGGTAILLWSPPRCPPVPGVDDELADLSTERACERLSALTVCGGSETLAGRATTRLHPAVDLLWLSTTADLSAAGSAHAARAQRTFCHGLNPRDDRILPTGFLSNRAQVSTLAATGTTRTVRLEIAGQGLAEEPPGDAQRTIRGEVSLEVCSDEG